MANGRYAGPIWRGGGLRDLWEGLNYDEDLLLALEDSCGKREAVGSADWGPVPPPFPGAGCRAEGHLDYQELLSRGHGQRQPPTLCHHPGKPRQVSGPSTPPAPAPPRGGPQASLWATGRCRGGCQGPPCPAPASPLSCSPPRVKRLGCFDHAQRQLGERCLYVFPAKVEPAKIACECPEKHCAQGEGSMAKKVCPRGWGLAGV